MVNSSMSTTFDPNIEDRQTIINHATSKKCIICFEKKIDTTCVPCGHTIMCEDCSEQEQVAMTCCPVCRHDLDIIIGIENSVDWAKEENRTIIVTGS